MARGKSPEQVAKEMTELRDNVVKVLWYQQHFRAADLLRATMLELTGHQNPFGSGTSWTAHFSSQIQITEKLRALDEESVEHILTAVQELVDPEYSVYSVAFPLDRKNPVADEILLARIDAMVSASDPLNHEVIRAQLTKCETKLASGDYAGCLTAARTLVEAVLREMEHRLTGTLPKADGDLVGYYNRVKKHLNLDPGGSGSDGKELAKVLKQILSGLVSIVDGLGSLRNKMSDAHAPGFLAARHHARLGVNCAQTLTDFLFSTFEFQQAKKASQQQPPKDNDQQRPEWLGVEPLPWETIPLGPPPKAREKFEWEK